MARGKQLAERATSSHVLALRSAPRNFQGASINLRRNPHHRQHNLPGRKKMTTPQQPGWYEDPNDSKAQRYWDGQDWTPHRQRKPISRDTPPSNTPAQPSPPAPVTPAKPVPPSPPAPSSQSPSVAPPQRSRLSRQALAVITGVAVLATAAVLVYMFVLPDASSNPDSPQAACDAMKDPSNTSGMSWYQGRRAAGDSYRQIQSILTDADHKCRSTIGPQMMSIARQMAKDSLNELLTYRHGGH
jgi:hypothetical protein